MTSNRTNESERMLIGRTAVIAGAGRGIGRAIALAFSRSGANLVLASRTESDLDDVALNCVHGGAVITVPTDVADREQVQRLADTAIQRFRHIDILVVSAGIHGPIGPMAEVDLRSWERAVAVNLLGPLYLCHAFVPHMLSQGSGKVIFLSGGGATAPLPFLSAYAASKAGSIRLAETLAEELRGSNVQVNSIAPGLVDTGLQDDVLEAGSRAGPEYARVRRARDTGEGAVSPDLAAALAVFLASPASGSITGKLIAAQHDPWRSWEGQGDQLNATAMYTLRRVDPFTIGPLLDGRA